MVRSSPALRALLLLSSPYVIWRISTVSRSPSSAISCLLPDCFRFSFSGSFTFPGLFCTLPRWNSFTAVFRQPPPVPRLLFTASNPRQLSIDDLREM